MGLWTCGSHAISSTRKPGRDVQRRHRLLRGAGRTVFAVAEQVLERPPVHQVGQGVGVFVLHPQRPVEDPGAVVGAVADDRRDLLLVPSIRLPDWICRPQPSFMDENRWSEQRSEFENSTSARPSSSTSTNRRPASRPRSSTTDVPAGSEKGRSSSVPPAPTAKTAFCFGLETISSHRPEPPTSRRRTPWSTPSLAV